MIGTIFKKELRDTLRDRRTVMMMIVIPTLIFPIIMNIFVGVSSSFQAEAAEKKVSIGLCSQHTSRLEKELLSLPASLGKKEIIPVADTNAMIAALRTDSLQIGLYIPENADDYLAKKEAIPVKIFFDATEVGMQERAEVYLNYISEKLKKERFIELKIDEKTLVPMELNYTNVASDKEMIGTFAGGVLPYIFIAFGFLGCMYPAIDLFTGEKERGTIETLLTTPVPRWKILVGKMGVVVLSGLTASTFSLLGLFFSIEVMDLVKDKELLAIIHGILTPGFIILMYCLLFPLTVFFAGIMIPIAVRAKSFKEAQSIISPLNILIVLPAMIGFFPGVELNYITSLIPVVNVVLATKELIAGTLEWQLIAIAFGTMCLLATLMVMVSHRKFGSEQNVVN
jgi:sodium transport system permease protein